MWFKLNTTFTTSLGKLSELTNSWPITRYLTNFTTASNVLNVEKNGAYEAVFTIGANCTVDAAPTVTMSGVAVSASQAVWNASAGTLTVKISSVTGPVVITASATRNSSSGGDSGGATTNYTFTINPNPTSATVTLSATGYSTVSGTGSKSITVANGTKVNWSVSASGYTTRTGSWTISGGNKTENITLTATSGGGGGTAETDISSLFTSTWREAGGAIIVDSTKSNYGWHQANQSAYRCSGSYVDVTKYTTYFDGKNVKLQITLPRATNSAHVQYGLAFYSNTTVGSTGVADVILGTCPMQYKAADNSNPTVETREITIPAGTKYIKTTWLTAANETTLGAVFSAKIIPN